MNASPALKELIGTTVHYAKTVSESDVYLFAGLTGDLSPNHVNEEFMKKTGYGGRIAHGALLVGYMSGASTKAAELVGLPIVSYGYDRIRFTGPVFIGDTISIRYTIDEVDEEQQKTFASIEVRNEKDDLVAVGTHIMKVVGYK